MSIDHILNRFRIFRRAHNLTASEFGKMVGLGDTTLRYMMTEEWNPTASVIRQIDRHLPKKFMQPANDTGSPGGAIGAAPADRGDDQTEAA